MEKLVPTPSQTIGPYFAYSLTAAQYGYPYNSIINNEMMAAANDQQQSIEIIGTVFDGEGNPINDAMIELWQADASGSYRSVPIQEARDNNTGMGRMGTGADDQNKFSFITTKPGRVNEQAPHINVTLFMRGALLHLYTRIYFSDEENAGDKLFEAVSEARRNTLIAERQDIGNKIIYKFDIHMQGAKETVFFDM